MTFWEFILKLDEDQWCVIIVIGAVAFGALMSFLLKWKHGPNYKNIDNDASEYYED